MPNGNGWWPPRRPRLQPPPPTTLGRSPTSPPPLKESPDLEAPFEWADDGVPQVEESAMLQIAHKLWRADYTDHVEDACGLAGRCAAARHPACRQNPAPLPGPACECRALLASASVNRYEHRFPYELVRKPAYIKGWLTNQFVRKRGSHTNRLVFGKPRRDGQERRDVRDVPDGAPGGAAKQGRAQQEAGWQVPASLQ